ncbi:MAG: diguanylate cyclase [Sphingomonadales bacterium]|nr:diguanylate cyclase [Sphingomonadales bacterium]MDE2171599.1 diguanylate cyclase [Sphingomonadales bacterium]
MEGWKQQVRRVLDAHDAIIAVADKIDAVFDAVVANALIAMPRASGAVIEMRDGEEIVYCAASGEDMADSIGLRMPIAGSLSGLCLASGTPQLCTDSETDVRVNREACRAVHVRSMVVVPIPAQGRDVGVLKVSSREPNAFDENDLLVVRLLSAPIAVGLANAGQIDLARRNFALGRRFEATFEQAAVGIIHVAPSGAFLRVNRKFCQITGRSAQELYACTFQDITHPDDLDADVEQFNALRAGETESYQLEKRYLLPDGASVWINLTVSMVAHEDGTPDFFVAVVEDISLRKDAETLAMRDALTGLPNRRAMLQRLERAVDGLPQGEQGLAVAYLDLDRFKQVNDRLGHAVGDECLVEVARAINGAVRQNDTLYRIAGDEFVLLLPGCNVTDVERILDRLNRAIAQRIAGRGWDVGVSAGAVVLGPGTRAMVEDVIHAADMMMYNVKILRKDGGAGNHLVRLFGELSSARH